LKVIFVLSFFENPSERGQDAERHSEDRYPQAGLKQHHKRAKLRMDEPQLPRLFLFFCHLKISLS